MFARVRGLLGRQHMPGVVASLVIHGFLLVLALGLIGPGSRSTVKRGEPLFVELPELPEPAPAGNPAARSAGPPAPEAAAPRPTPPRPEPKVAAPAPPRPAAPPPRPPVVASRPAPPAPPSGPAPEPRTQDAPPRPQEPSPEAAQPDQPPSPPTAAAPAPEPHPQVAAAPPPAATTPPSGAVDIRSALGRGGGAGGLKGGGRGGIEGEPIPLDSADPKFNDFLERLRRRIKANWGFPCIKNEVTRGCDYKTTFLVVDFGILKDGKLQFVEVVQSSDFPIYDDYAVNAIKLASPFPAVPSSMIVAMKQGSTGVAIRARFNYIVDTSLTNLLR